MAVDGNVDKTAPLEGLGTRAQASTSATCMHVDTSTKLSSSASAS
jgi:hypothetical protein